MKNRIDSPIMGYLLIPSNAVLGYCGVDRDPFVPTLLENEIDPNADMSEATLQVADMYPPGWRRDAYQLYKQNLVPGADEKLLDLSSNLEAAREIQHLIHPFAGPHDIVACKVWSLDSMPIAEEIPGSDLLGYDVAYPGGDFYSAILNGLFVNPDITLLQEYKPLLNAFGLFSSFRSIPAYIGRFRERVGSEVNSQFCIFQLALAG